MTPRYIFGVNAGIKNSLHLVEDNKLMYVAGHNVIIYDAEDRSSFSSQFFIPGTEGVDRINAISVSNSKAPLLAICEAEDKKARVTLWNLASRKRIKHIPD